MRPMMSVSIASAIAFVVIGGLSVTAAHAEPGDAESDARPWAEGVSAAAQERALALYDDGNELLRAARFVEAAARYREAIEHWDHPGIHYNLTLALIQLEQPVEAYASVRKALRFGAEALEPDEYEQAQNYRTLLAQQVVTVEVTCQEPGAQVYLDGKEMFVGPGTGRRILLPGEHQVVASKEGFVTVTRPLLLLPGKPVTVAIELHRPVVDATVLERRWSSWSPWVTVGVGAALGLGGGALYWRADRNFARFDDDFAVACPTGCPDDDAPQDLLDRKSRATQQRGIGITGLVAGGAVLGTGMVMVYLNRPRAVRKERLSGDEVTGQHPGVDRSGTGRSSAGQRISIIPLLSPRGAGVSAYIPF